MNKRELCFKIEFKNIDSIEEEEITDILIEFAVNHNVSVSGNLDGFCFCVDIGNEIPKELKNNFLLFMDNNYAELFEEIVFE